MTPSQPPRASARDVNLSIKLLLSELEDAANQAPEFARAGRARRRRIVVNAIWKLFRRARS